MTFSSSLLILAGIFLLGLSLAGWSPMASLIFALLAVKDFGFAAWIGYRRA